MIHRIIKTWLYFKKIKKINRVWAESNSSLSSRVQKNLARLDFFIEPENMFELELDNKFEPNQTHFFESSLNCLGLNYTLVAKALILCQSLGEMVNTVHMNILWVNAKSRKKF